VVIHANGDLFVKPEDIACSWRKYFDAVLNARNDLFPGDNGSLGINEEDSEDNITEGEFKEQLQA